MHLSCFCCRRGLRVKSWLFTTIFGSNRYRKAHFINLNNLFGKYQLTKAGAVSIASTLVSCILFGFLFGSGRQHFGKITCSMLEVRENSLFWSCHFERLRGKASLAGYSSPPPFRLSLLVLLTNPVHKSRLFVLGSKIVCMRPYLLPLIIIFKVSCLLDGSEDLKYGLHASATFTTVFHVFDPEHSVIDIQSSPIRNNHTPI